MLIRINRLLSFEDVVSKYGGPPGLWDKLRASLPVWSRHQGQDIYLESEVDDFLKSLYRKVGAHAATPSSDADITGTLASTVVSAIDDRMGKLEDRIDASRDREAYTTHQASKRLGKSAWTVRRWAELGQIRAEKVLMGRTGRKGEWRISAEEVARIEREGPQPEGTYSN